nr:G472 [uncultured bacterium]
MKKSTAKPAADADQVAAYLLLNPDFFERHPQVFEALDVPHPTGGAVSLVERQVAVLRERNRALTARLDAVIEAAHRHDDQYRKLFELAIALAACRDIPALLHALATHLRRDFGTDALRVLARQTCADDAALLVSAFDPAPFAADIERSKPRCLPQSELPTVQPYLDAQTASAAILPLAATEPALLLLGSHDPERFSPELGTLLLERLAHLTGAHWHRLSGA